MRNYPVAKVKDVPPGRMIGAEINGRRILVANVAGEFYAMGARCNHMGGHLERGTLEGNVVTCPLHNSKWDVKTGQLVYFTRHLPPEQVFKVAVEGEDVMVEA